MTLAGLSSFLGCTREQHTTTPDEQDLPVVRPRHGRCVQRGRPGPRLVRHLENCPGEQTDKDY
ncbi:MAG: hypothetical protein M3332_02525 [Actinomycetota bacterium]|nr:hypothetical protein [Actinomycetota bacterium]